MPTSTQPVPRAFVQATLADAIRDLERLEERLDADGFSRLGMLAAIEKIRRAHDALENGATA